MKSWKRFGSVVTTAGLLFGLVIGGTALPASAEVDTEEVVGGPSLLKVRFQPTKLDRSLTDATVPVWRPERRTDGTVGG